MIEWPGRSGNARFFKPADRPHYQWARYLLMNRLGFVLNRGTYAALVTWVPLCATQPVFAVAGGAVASRCQGRWSFPRHKMDAVCYATDHDGRGGP
jgi:hypothetical protein